MQKIKWRKQNDIYPIDRWFLVDFYDNFYGMVRRIVDIIYEVISNPI